MAKRPRTLTPKRGEVYLVSFDPTVGSEIKKTRPAVVVQNDISNRHSPITIVVAITAQFDEPLYPTEVLIPRGQAGMRTASVVLLNQIRSIDRRRLVRKLGVLSSTMMTQVDDALEVSLGLRSIE